MTSLDCVENTVTPSASECAPRIDRQDVDQMLRHHLNRGAADHMRSVDLRVLMARLPGESVVTVGEMLSISPRRLRAFLRGDAYLNQTQAGRVGLLLEVVRTVTHVIDPSAISRWLDVEIPAFGRSPRGLLSSGKGEDLRVHVARYLKTAYS